MSWLVLRIVCARIVWVFVLVLVYECSCGWVGVALGYPPPSWMPGVGFCGVDGVLGESRGC